MGLVVVVARNAISGYFYKIIRRMWHLRLPEKSTFHHHHEDVNKSNDNSGPCSIPLVCYPIVSVQLAVRRYAVPQIIRAEWQLASNRHRLVTALVTQTRNAALVLPLFFQSSIRCQTTRWKLNPAGQKTKMAIAITAT